MVRFKHLSVLCLALTTTPLAAQTVSSSAYGARAELGVGSIIDVGIGPVAQSSGSGAAGYSDTASVLTLNESLALGNVLGTVFAQSLDSGVMTSSATSDYPNTQSATASAQIVDLSASLTSKILFLPELSLTGFGADVVQSTSTVSAVGGMLSAVGNTTIAGLTLGGLNLGGLLIDTSLFVNPAANTVLVNLLGLKIVLNEQIITGDGISSLGIETNAIRATFNDFLLGGRLLNGDLVFAHSQASITGYNPAAAVPEPATWAMLIAGFGMIGFAARRRPARAAVLA